MRSGDESVSVVGAREVRRRIRRRRVLAWIVFGCAFVIGFECVLYTTALTLFTHFDTPECAGSNTFCYPDGRSGITGGAVVVMVGNLAAVVIGAALLALALLRRRGVRARL
jgi:hypothetical protein